MPDFLKDIAGTAMNLLGNWATGGFKGRPQWRDLSFMNDAQNRLWPDEIKRQGAFLEGLAPSQADAHNTFQDQTYMRDVTRRTEGIKQMGSDLGMSPWELTGQGGAATPLPSSPSGPSGGGGQMQSFLQGIMPLKLAQMQNATSLQIAKMQNQTQRYGIDMAGGQSDVSKKQIEQIASQIKLQDIQHSNGVKDLETKNQQMSVTLVDALLRMMPKDTFSIPGFTSTNTPGWQAVAKSLLRDYTPGNTGKLANTISQLPPDAWGHIKRVIIEAAEDTVQLGADIANQTKNFLGGK